MRWSSDLDPMEHDPEEVILWMNDTLADWCRLHPISDDLACVLAELAETADRIVAEHDRQADELEEAAR